MVEDSKMMQRIGGGGMNDNKEFEHIGWKYPADEYIKLNVDRCSKGNPRVAGAEAVIQDHMGTWIVGFGRNIGFCSLVTAKLWAIYVGLQITWDRGFRNVILESYSKVVVGFINENSVSVDRNYNLIMQIKGISGRD